MIQKLSVSAISLFKACRRAYELKYVYGVVPKEEQSEALKTGSAYHTYIEQIQRTGEAPEIVDKETAMANAYYQYVYPKMPKFEPEMWFEKSVGRGMKLIGRLDGKADGEVIEHKTTSLNTEEYEYNLNILQNDQLLAYFLATGYNKAYYTVCKKPALRQKKDETLEEFGQRCFEWYSEDTDSKIKMFVVTKTDEEIKEYHNELKKMFATVRAAKKGNFYRNTCNCNVWGRMCEYAPICMNYDPNVDYVGFERSTYEDNKHSGEYQR